MPLGKAKLPSRELGSSYHRIILSQNPVPIETWPRVSRSRAGWLLTNWLALAKPRKSFISCCLKAAGSLESSVGRGFGAAGVRGLTCWGVLASRGKLYSSLAFLPAEQRARQPATAAAAADGVQTCVRSLGS